MNKELANDDYEKALLGSIILDNTVLEDPLVRPNLFYHREHALLCQAMIDLAASGVKIDALSLYDLATKRHGKLVRINGSYIADLSQIITSAANAPFYREKLAELAELRQLKHLSEDVLSIIDAGSTAKEVKQRIEKALVDLSQGRQAGYSRLSEAIPTVLKTVEENFRSKGQIRGVPTGFAGLDDLLGGLKDQEVIVIGARPGTGKTSIALNMISECVKKNIECGLISAEMPISLILTRLVSSMGRIDSGKIKTGFLSPSDVMSIQDEMAKLYTSNVFVNDTPNIAFDYLRSEARKMRRNEGIKILFVDYLGLLVAENQNVPRYEQISEISRNTKALARELNIPIVLLCQLTREAQDKRPNLAQLRDSGAIEQDADVVMFLWNRGFTDEIAKNKLNITLIVDKNRNGPVGEVPLFMEPAYTLFTENVR